MKANYQVMICQTYEDPLKEISAVDVLLNSHVDGIIATLSKKTINFNHFRQSKGQGGFLSSCLIARMMILKQAVW